MHHTAFISCFVHLCQKSYNTADLTCINLSQLNSNSYAESEKNE